MSRFRPLQLWLARISLAVLIAWAALLAHLSWLVGPSMFEGGRSFWTLQATLALAVFGTSFPLERRWVSWLAALRLVFALAMLAMLLAVYSVTDGFRY